jgi:hypothetical protein
MWESDVLMIKFILILVNYLKLGNKVVHVTAYQNIWIVWIKLSI